MDGSHRTKNWGLLQLDTSSLLPFSRREGRKELFHTLPRASVRSWHRVLGVSHPLSRAAVPRFPASHPAPQGGRASLPSITPSSAPAATSLPLARFFSRGSVASARFSREGRRLLAVLEQFIIVQKGMGGAWKTLQGHKYLEKARKTPIPRNISPPCRGHWFGH